MEWILRWHLPGQVIGPVLFSFHNSGKFHYSLLYFCLWLILICIILFLLLHYTIDLVLPKKLNTRTTHCFLSAGKLFHAIHCISFVFTLSLVLSGRTGGGRIHLEWAQDASSAQLTKSSWPSIHHPCSASTLRGHGLPVSPKSGEDRGLLGGVCLQRLPMWWRCVSHLCGAYVWAWPWIN